MNDKTILFYGWDRWIGSMFLEYLILNSEFVIFKGKLHDSLELIKDEIESIQPTHVIDFTFSDNTTNLEENLKTNLWIPSILAQLSIEFSYHYTYLSDGCIFYDSKPGTVKFIEESDANNFNTEITTIKCYADDILKFYNYRKSLLNLRIQMPVSIHDDQSNFLTQLVACKEIYNSQCSITVLEDFFPIFHDLISESKTGTYNCTNPGTITYVKILELYKQIVNPIHTWTLVSTDINNKNWCSNYLETTKIENEFSKYDIMNIKESVLNVLRKKKLQE
jgi:hypothetical protein